VAAITDMNEEIDVRPVLPTVRVPALVLYREQEYLRDASRYMGERLPGAQVIEVPGVDHLPWEGDQTAVLDEIERFLGMQDLVAGSGIDFDERGSLGELRLFSVLR
jgi:pimeloyl-ACP methyl ester carboxylesterase